MDGRIEVICGPMFSGKSEELIRRIRRATIAKLRVQAFKPRIDNRYALHEVTSHNKTSFMALSVYDANEILDIVTTSRPDVIAIDEAQFLGKDLAPCCDKLANLGSLVIVAGLDMDSMGKAFENMAELLAKGDKIMKLSAICVSCGTSATRTHRKDGSTERIAVGGAEQYEARCRKCYNKNWKV